MTLLNRIAVIIALGLLAFTTGWIAKGLSVKTQQETAVHATLTETKREIERSAVVSTTLETAIHVDAARIDKIEVAVAERIKNNTPPRHDKHNHTETTAHAAGLVLSPVPAADLHPVLDVGTVRLLNAARSGMESTTIDTGQEQAASASAR